MSTHKNQIWTATSNLATVPGSRSREFFWIFIKTANMSRDTNFQNFLLPYSETTHQKTPVREVSAKLGNFYFFVKKSWILFEIFLKNSCSPNLAATSRTGVILCVLSEYGNKKFWKFVSREILAVFMKIQKYSRLLDPSTVARFESAVQILFLWVNRNLAYSVKLLKIFSRAGQKPKV